MTLRESAQALLDHAETEREVHRGNGTERLQWVVADDVRALTEALASPDPAGWAEGVTDAGRALAEHLNEYRLPDGASPDFAAGVRHHTAHVLKFTPCALPVPSAPVTAPEARGTFPGDLDRMPSGHTRHCESRIRYGDGECECGIIKEDGHVEACGNGGENPEDCSPECFTACHAVAVMRGDYLPDPGLTGPSAPEAKTAESEGPTLAMLLDGFDAEIERRAQALRRPRGGQTVTPGGDFVNVTPSTLGRLRWWSRAFREAARIPAPVEPEETQHTKK